jgi:hypothetical protein
MHVRFKNRFGRRYMSDREFLDYASDLNLLTDYPSSSLLEFTEKHGIIAPIARVRFPPEIARCWYKERYPQADTPDPVEGDTPRLEAATTLREEIYSNLWGNAEIYGERTHLLDDIAPEHAPFIQTTFGKKDFIPWKEFRTVVALRDGKEMGDGGDSVRSCYHYWQVFALAAFLRSGISILYDLSDEELFQDLLRLRIPDAARGKLYTSINLEARHELAAIMEKRQMFDAVAYFEAYRHNALQKHARDFDHKTGRLPLNLSREYRKRERALARDTLQRFKLKPSHVLEFIKFQCDLWDTATKRSSGNVADEYSRNIHSTIDLYRLVSRASVIDITRDVRKRGGHFKPILKVIFPDWLEEQRDLAERSLKSWIVPSMLSLPPHFSVLDQDVAAFCEWIGQQGLLQLYWHFKRMIDIGHSEDSISQSATAAEVVGFANTVELVVNAVLVGRKQSPRGHTLLPKIKSIFLTGSPQLVQLIDQHKKLTQTNNSTLKARIAQIDRVKKGGADAPVVRAILKLVVIRNEGSHLGLRNLDRQGIYALLEALICATLIIWKVR